MKDLAASPSFGDKQRLQLFTIRDILVTTGRPASPILHPLKEESYAIFLVVGFRL
jgi:hypothetical protein